MNPNYWVCLAARVPFSPVGFMAWLCQRRLTELSEHQNTGKSQEETVLQRFLALGLEGEVALGSDGCLFGETQPKKVQQTCILSL